MKLRLLLAFIALTLAARASDIPLVQSPEVHPDRRVTFRLFAPKATAVELQCESQGPARLTRAENGVWSVTLGPLEPDLYVYSFLMDGFRTLDPRNPRLKYNLINSASELHVPGASALPWEVQDVPRGVVHRHSYRSGRGGDDRDFLVYTPPGYDPAKSGALPVLYLLHGFSDDATTWSTIGRAPVMLDNLLARKRAVPMLIVMPFGYGRPEVVAAGWDHLPAKAEMVRNITDFGPILLEEIVPLVEQLYAASPRATDRAIAGLSMGGAQALIIGLNHLDQFAYVGCFSAGGDRAEFEKQFGDLDETANERLRVLWLACGRADKEALPGTRELSAWLHERRVRHELHVDDGGHSFRAWRRYFLEFTPQLFAGERID